MLRGLLAAMLVCAMAWPATAADDKVPAWCSDFIEWA